MVKVAACAGIEPASAERQSAVLPLHQHAKSTKEATTDKGPPPRASGGRANRFGPRAQRSLPPGASRQIVPRRRRAVGQESVPI